MSSEMSQRLDIEMSLQALRSELMNLVTLECKLEASDKQMLKECGFKINQLLLESVL